MPKARLQLGFIALGSVEGRCDCNDTNRFAAQLLRRLRHRQATVHHCTRNHLLRFGIDLREPQ